ncbi:hypothetical protein B0H14DRAFT_2638240 [Mycena olivaceomarginata]|nr:hypothetical protein B0H14DRAFT_2638240 [Mycena olivaceomarginata]
MCMLTASSQEHMQYTICPQYSVSGLFGVHDFGTFSEPTSNQSALDWDSDLVGTYFPESSLQPDSDIKGSSSDDGHTPYELTPDEIDVVIGPATATVTLQFHMRLLALAVFHIELVNGIPSQFPIPEELTAFIVCADTLDAEDKRKTIDAILKTMTPIPTRDRLDHGENPILRQAKVQVEAELKQAVAESKSHVEQVPRLRVTAQRKHKSTIRGAGTMMCSMGKRVKHCKRATKPAENILCCSYTHLRSHGANVPFATSTRDTAPSTAKRKSTLTAAAPAPKPKRRKAGDPLAGWAIELGPGDKTTAVSPQEYAQKELEEFAAQYPQYIKFL